MPGAPPRLGFLVASALACPGVVAWANNLKLGADLAIVVTLVVTIVLKLDLRSEALSASDYGIALVVVNVGVPLSLLAYYCVPTLLGRSTLGDASRARQVFELLDVDGTGVVTREQVRQLLRATHSIQVGDATTVVSEDDGGQRGLATRYAQPPLEASPLQPQNGPRRSK